MNSENQKIDADLIGKYLAGEASPEEAMLVDEWLAEPGNKNEFDKYAKLWDLVGESAGPKVPDAQQTWSDLQDAIHTSPKHSPANRKWIRVGIAASVASLVLVAYYLFQKETAQTSSDGANMVISRKATNEKIGDTLNDGTVITLNKNSSISYTNQFNLATRELVLSGEAFFHVKPDKTKPFIITVDDLKVEVVGTSFNVRKHPSTENIEVQVQTGIVKMYTRENSLMVSKGQSGMYTKRDHMLRLKDSIDLNSIGYATNSFYFNDISLTEACNYLAHSFNVDIKIDAKKFGDCRLSAEFDNKSLTYILEVINATFNTTYNREGNTIFISGNGCQ